MTPDKDVEADESKPVVARPPSPDPVTVEMHPRNVDYHPLSEVEMEMLSWGAPPLLLAACSASVGACASFATVVFSQQLTAGPRAAFLTLFGVTAFLAVVTGVCTYLGRRTITRRLGQILIRKPVKAAGRAITGPSDDHPQAR